jgi:hypothetical protein
MTGHFWNRHSGRRVIAVEGDQIDANAPTLGGAAYRARSRRRPYFRKTTNHIAQEITTPAPSPIKNPRVGPIAVNRPMAVPTIEPIAMSAPPARG